MNTTDEETLDPEIARIQALRKELRTLEQSLGLGLSGGGKRGRPPAKPRDQLDKLLDVILHLHTTSLSGDTNAFKKARLQVNARLSTLRGQSMAPESIWTDDDRARLQAIDDLMSHQYGDTRCLNAAGESVEQLWRRAFPNDEDRMPTDFHEAPTIGCDEVVGRGRPRGPARNPTVKHSSDSRQRTRKDVTDKSSQLREDATAPDDLKRLQATQDLWGLQYEETAEQPLEQTQVHVENDPFEVHRGSPLPLEEHVRDVESDPLRHLLNDPGRDLRGSPSSLKEHDRDFDGLSDVSSVRSLMADLASEQPTYESYELDKLGFVPNPAARAPREAVEFFPKMRKLFAELQKFSRKEVKAPDGSVVPHSNLVNLREEFYEMISSWKSQPRVSESEYAQIRDMEELFENQYAEPGRRRPIRSGEKARDLWARLFGLRNVPQYFVSDSPGRPDPKMVNWSKQKIVDLSDDSPAGSVFPIVDSPQSSDPSGPNPIDDFLDGLSTDTNPFLHVHLSSQVDSPIQLVETDSPVDPLSKPPRPRRAAGSRDRSRVPKTPGEFLQQITNDYATYRYQSPTKNLVVGPDMQRLEESLVKSRAEWRVLWNMARHARKETDNTPGITHHTFHDKFFAELDRRLARIASSQAT